ncbi:MAG: acyl carrier protein [Lactobacillus sp.]|jgi:acyl carrier protein|nr:acyl carrier protein [Lactobacillus sp.]MCI1480951.1 acyl carrier protein [Lactobacillus sp.]MCI1883402.1 acyl carrier protein [Lactobacillus sp.]MCI1916398.1 acyl carrier protein [Lactobacillus sp.]MCI1943452.1 acyl carrier protein [Lactobacillus sp.]
MSEQEIFNKIADLLVKNFDVKRDQITNDLNFTNDLDADSIDFVEFVLDLEDTFGAEIPDEDAEQLQTVGEAVTYIKNHLN